MGTVVMIKKAFIFLPTFFISFFFSFYIWFAVTMGVSADILDMRMSDFIEHLFGPMVTIYEEIGNRSRTSSWFTLDVFELLGCILYLYILYSVVKKYFRSDVKYNNWKMIGWIFFISLFWTLWGGFFHIASYIGA